MSQILRTFIVISAAIILWGSILFGLRWIIKYFWDFSKFKEYLLALIDAAFFVLPYLTGAKYIIDELSNYAWIIIGLFIDIVGYGLILYNIIAIVIDIFSTRIRLGRTQYKWYKIDKKWDKRYLNR